MKRSTINKIANLIVTIVTAIVSAFFVQSCKSL